MSKKKNIRFMDTILRDSHQSLIATRMSTEDMLPAMPLLNKAGYDSLEVWGGATFDSCLRFLHEDPWERLRIVRKNCPDVKLAMLLRGQNLLGYKHYPDDVVDSFVKYSIKNGIDIFRVFDALNDVRNMEQSVRSIKKYGGTTELAICYTTSDVHTLDYYLKLTKELLEFEPDRIAIKDMAGILEPGMAYNLVSGIKKLTDLPVHIHTHCTAGIGEMAELMAAQAGADIIDTALSPFAGGTSQPATETMHITLEQMGYDTGLDLKILQQAADHFKEIKQKYADNKLFDPKVLAVEPQALIFQVPGGMLSNLMSQLKEAGQSSRYDEVLQEVPRVRAELGYPPLVTPMSQMVGTQAAMNVLIRSPRYARDQRLRQWTLWPHSDAHQRRDSQKDHRGCRRDYGAPCQSTRTSDG